MSRRGLLIAFGAVTVALTLTVGVLIGILASRNNDGVYGDNAGIAESTHVSTITPDGGASPLGALDASERALAEVNLACSKIDNGGTLVYWVDVITVHGVDTGVIKESTTGGQQLDDVYRQWRQDVETSLAAAATYDGRWATLHQLVIRDENAAIRLWDQGGVSAVAAAKQAVGADLDTVGGVCSAARSEFRSLALGRGERVEALLAEAGATKEQIRVYDLWSP